MATDTMSILCDIYMYNWDTGDIFPIKTDYVTIPKSTDFPGVSKATPIFSGDSTGAYYNSFRSACPQYKDMWGTSVYSSEEYWNPSTYFKSKFPRTDGYISHWGSNYSTGLIIVNKKNGKCLLTNNPSSNDYIFASLDKLRSGRANYEYNLTNRAFHMALNGEGSTLGDLHTLTYTGYDVNNGMFTGFEYVTIRGTKSTNNTIYYDGNNDRSSTFIKGMNLFFGAGNVEPFNPNTDPYNPNAEPGGGDGETQTADSITDPALPTISSVDTGFITLYKPSISQLNALATWMWGSLDIDMFKRVMQSPMDAVLGLSILPGIVPSGSSSSVKIGNLDSGVSMSKVSSQYMKFDCGSLTVKRKWGAFLDYSPYTKTYLYLPFIGIRSVETDSIMNTPVHIKYNIDVMSGACCAFVIANGTTLYSFIGQCSCSVPVTGRDWTNLINGVLGAVSGVASAAGSAASGNIMGAVSGIASAASSALSAKPTIEHSGSMGGMGGLMGIKRPYFIIERPVQAVPGHQNDVIGYPSFVYKYISQLSGYTEFEQIHLEGIPCTSDELNEIENILLSGVIL